MHFLVRILFFTSILFLPWYIVVAMAIALIVYCQAYVSVIVGGIILDSLFGFGLITFGGFPFLYTALFVGMSFIHFVLFRAMME